MSKVINLADHREPVTYTLTITHHWDGTLEIYVDGVEDDERSRESVWDALDRYVQQHKYNQLNPEGAND